MRGGLTAGVIIATGGRKWARRSSALTTSSAILRAGGLETVVALITVTLIGPDEKRSTVMISEDTTVRDVATSEYHLFWRSIKRNGTIVPFTASVRDGDIVTVENELMNER
jgi:hypothetical protein